MPTRSRRSRPPVLPSSCPSNLTVCQNPFLQCPSSEYRSSRGGSPPATNRISSARKCPVCSTVVFPPREGACPNPTCDSDELDPTPLSRRGTVWSYTENHYAPPPPYVAADPFEPYALAAVELADEGIVVLGQVAKGVRAADLRVGHGDAARARQCCTHDDEHEYARVRLGTGRSQRVQREQPNATSPSSASACTRGASGVTTSPSTAWSRRAPRSTDAGLAWHDIQYVAGADTIRNGYPGFIAGATFAQKLGWTGVRVSSSYAACASGAHALHNARAQILAGFCDVALVVGADTTPKGFFAPVGGERTDRPRLAALPSARRHQPRVLRALRPPPHGPLRRDQRRLRAGQGEELAARSREPERALPQGEHGRRRRSRARSSPTRCGCSTSARPPTAARR